MSCSNCMKCLRTFFVKLFLSFRDLESVCAGRTGVGQGHRCRTLTVCNVLQFLAGDYEQFAPKHRRFVLGHVPLATPGWLRSTAVEGLGLCRRTFPVLRSTSSWWITTYVDKPSAAGQPTRPTQPFILSRSINWVVSRYPICAQVALSGECLRVMKNSRRKRTKANLCYFAQLANK